MIKNILRFIASAIAAGTILFVSLVLTSHIAFGQGASYKITRVIDGDTVEIEAPFIPDPLEKKLSVRLLGVDTPESKHRAKCAKERAMAQQAVLLTTKEINAAKTTKIELVKWDKYGGRVLGNIILDNVPLTKKLIDAGLAVEYTGKGPKKDWCS